jgi:regulatory protein
VARHLEYKGVSAETVAQVLEALTENGILDDARFARLFVQDKRELEQWGAERIRRGLLERGLDRELIAEVLDDADEPELDRALAILQRRFPSPPRERRERDRALGVLIRKGYDPDLALDALAAYGRAHS